MVHTLIQSHWSCHCSNLSTLLYSFFLSLRFSSALLEAAQADKKIEEKGGEDVLKHQFPLLGVPISVKESFSLQGTQLLMLSGLFQKQPSIRLVLVHTLFDL